MPTDYYELLGVARNATDDEIKRAYRALARRLHPDANPGDVAAEARFKEISVAYEALRDPERRRRYDMFGPEGASGSRGQGAGDPFGGLNDLFDAFFGGDPFGGRRGPTAAPRGADAETVLTLDLATAAFGSTQSLELTLPVGCDRCAGSGCEPGTHPARCEMCGGAGEVRQVRRSLLGQLVTAAACPTCGATGSVIPSPCDECRGDGRVRAARTIEVEVPAGIDDGQRLRLSGRGPAGPRGAAPGDLYVTIRVEPHPELERHGADLLHVRSISIAQAALGTSLALATLDGEETLAVPSGTQPGTVLRVRGRGVPHLRGRGRGDLLVRIDVDVPRSLAPEEAELLRRLAEVRGEEIGSPDEPGLFSRIRSAFQ